MGENATSKTLGSVVNDASPMPPEAPSLEADEDLFDKHPWVDAPIAKIDYGYNIKCWFPPPPHVSVILLIREG